MDLQLSNPIASPIVSARAVAAPGAEAQNGQFQNDVAADAASANFAKLLAQALPRGNGRPIPAALKVSGADAKDQKSADNADLAADLAAGGAASIALSSPTPSALPSSVNAGDQKTPHATPHSARDTTEPGIEVTGPIMAGFMPARQEIGAKTAGGAESIRLPAASNLAQKSAAPTASITDAVGQPSANEAQAQEARPGFALQTEYAPTTEASALPDKKPVQATAFNAMPTDRMASMPLPVATAGEPSPVRQLSISAPLGNHDWNNQLGQQVVWLSSQHSQIAEIRINPPDLGPIELRLTLDQQQSAQNATLHFASPHAQVREAIENSMPRLRELMADAGITLGNATVSGESFARQQTSEQGSGAAKKLAASSSGTSGAIEAPQPSASRGSALLDTFA